MLSLEPTAEPTLPCTKQADGKQQACAKPPQVDGDSTLVWQGTLEEDSAAHVVITKTGGPHVVGACRGPEGIRCCSLTPHSCLADRTAMLQLHSFTINLPMLVSVHRQGGVAHDCGQPRLWNLGSEARGAGWGPRGCHRPKDPTEGAEDHKVSAFSASAGPASRWAGTGG